MSPVESSRVFKFLEYYEERDAAVFGGRERESLEIADRIAQARTYIFYGRSGLGKTSVLLAGVFPELRRRGWTPTYIRTLADPARDLLRACEALRRELEPTAGEWQHEPNRSTRDQILDLLRSLASSVGPLRVVLVLDQFEEFFIRFRGRPQVRSEFVAIVAAIVRERSIPVHVVFSLREDYLAEMDDFRSELPELFEDEYRLRAMTAFGVRQAVTRPLDAAGIPYQGRLVTRLLDRLVERRFDPVVLQILCNEVYARASARCEASGAELELRVEDLDAVGDIDQVFRRYLDSAAAHLDPDEQLVARGVLRCLTTQEHTKQALRLEDFTTAFVRLSELEAESMLELLALHRLIRIDRRGPAGSEQQTWYELTHDRLVPIISEWLRLDVEFNRLLAAEDLIATSVRSGLWRDASENLLGPGHLDNVVGPFRTRLRLSADKLELVLRSAIYHSHADVAAWALEFDQASHVGASAELVRALIDDDDPMMRAGAVFAAGRLATLDDELVAALVRASLDDAEADVRRAAGTAIAIGRVRHPELIPMLLEHGAGGDGKRLVETLADVYAVSHRLDGVPAWLRWRARSLATRRTAKQFSQAIAEARPTAAIGALLAGVVWILSLAPYGLLWSFGYTADRAREPEVVFGLSGAVLAAMVVLCVPFAWTAGGARVLRVRARGQTGLTAVSIGTWLTAAGLGLGVAAGVMFVGDALGRARQPGATLMTCALYWLALPATVALARRAIDPRQRFSRACGWSVLASLGLPVIVAWLAVGFSGHREAFVYAVVGLFGSALSATVTAGIARVEIEQELGVRAPETGRRRVVERAVIVALAVVALVFVLISVRGSAVLRWQPSSGVLAAGEQLELSGTLDPYGGLSSVHHHTVVVEAGKGARVPTRLVVEFEASPGVYGLYSDGRPIPGFWAPIDDKPRTLIVKPGRQSIALVADDELDYTLALRGHSVLRTGALALSGNEIVYAWTSWSAATPESEALADAPELTGADVVSSLHGEANAFDLVSVSFGERLVLDGSLDRAEFTGLQLHCQGAPILAQRTAGVSNSRFADDLPFVEAPGFDAELALTCSTYADAEGKWSIRFGATLSGGSAGSFDGQRLAAAVKRQPNDGNLLPTNAVAPDTLAEQELDLKDLAYVDFSGKTFRASSFRNADLSGTKFRLADLGVADETAETPTINDFTGAKGDWVDFSGAVLSFADFTNATLPSGQFQGVRRANDAKFIGATMFDANFDDAGLEGADFSAAKLGGTSMRNVRARGVSFRDADLSRVDFTGADLRGVDFTGAVLRGATLDLRSSEAGERPIFEGADVGGARVRVSDARTRIKQVCGKGGYTLVIIESDDQKSGAQVEQEQWVELPACDRVAQVTTPKSTSALRGACRTAPTPVGIYRNAIKEAEQICRTHPARSLAELRWVDGRYEWDTGKQLNDMRVRCGCELRPEYSSKLPPPARPSGGFGSPKQEQRDWNESYLLRKPAN